MWLGRSLRWHALDRLSGGRYERVVTLIAYLGLRKGGEALALSWSDIDLNRSTLRITGTLTRLDGQLVTTEPKTLNSRRTLPLSAEALTCWPSNGGRRL